MLKKAIRFLDLPEDVDPNVPRITVVGRELMLVENVAGIRRCTPEEVVLLTGRDTLQISEEGLRVKELGESRALLTGRLSGWGFEA